MRYDPDAPRIGCYSGLADLPLDFTVLFGESLFDSYGWYAATCAAALPPSAEAIFVTVTERGYPLAVFPMRRDVTKIAALTTPYTCLWRPLTVPGLTAAQLHGAALAFGRWCRSWATVRLDALDLRDPSWAVLLSGLRDAGLRPLPFNHFGNWTTTAAALGWESYLDGRPGELREALRRRGKRLAETGATLRVVTGEDDLAEGIAAYENVYAASWKQAEPFTDFNATLMRVCAQEGTLRLGLLEQQGKPIAAQFWVVQGSRATVLKLAHDESRKSASPGTVLTGMMIRHMLEQDRITTLDFGRGDDDYKQAWTDSRQQREGLILANPWRPGGLAAIARREVRKRWVARPPQTPRRQLGRGPNE